MALMSSCRKTDDFVMNDIVDNTTLEQTELSYFITSEVPVTKMSTSDTNVSDVDNIFENYYYLPPQEIIDTYFYCDDIEEEINCDEMELIGYDISHSYSNLCEKPDFINNYSDFKNVLPTFIVDDISNYYPNGYEVYMKKPFTGIKYMLHDMNDDGFDDYIIIGIRGSEGMLEPYYVYKIYIADNSGGYTPIIWDCLPMFHPVQYILKTKTNGLKDIMVLHNANYPIITYDGDDSYTHCKMIDEKHTFIDIEIMPNNILHLNMRVSVNDAPLGEYYTAIKFAYNTYLKNNMLYSCYPDGTARSYENNIGDMQANDFYASIDGYDFYVELTDEGVEAFTEETNIWQLLDLLEIKYVAVGDCN